MIVLGYTLHLYCDDPDHPRDKRPGALLDIGEFPGRRAVDAWNAARESGWTFFYEGGQKKCRCPNCRVPRRK